MALLVINPSESQALTRPEIMAIQVINGKDCYNPTSITFAYNLCMKNITTAHLSFTDEEGSHMFFPHFKGKSTSQIIEDFMNNLSETYKGAKEDDLFWTDEIMCPDEWANKFPTTKEEEDQFHASCIKTVLSDAMFKSKYGC